MSNELRAMSFSNPIEQIAFILLSAIGGGMY